MTVNVRPGDGYAAIDLSGPIDLGTSPELRSVFQDLARKGTPALVVNLEKVNYMDSSGVATLVECLQRLADYDGKMALCGITPRAREVLEITNLAGVFDFYDTEEEALRSLR